MGLFSTIASVAAPILGSVISGNKTANSQADVNADNYAMQKEFAQNSIRWKVEDAKAAGLHPLAALNAPAYQASPSYVGTDYTGMGQNISRAVEAVLTSGERSQKTRAENLALENMQLQNELLKSQITTVGSSSNPAWPSGSPQSSSVRPRPLEPIMSEGPYASKEVGSVTDYNYARTASGGLAIVPGNDVKQRIEDAFIPEMQWAIRNTHVLASPPYPDPKRFPLPKDMFWDWSAFRQEWRPRRRADVIDQQALTDRIYGRR